MRRAHQVVLFDLFCFVTWQAQRKRKSAAKPTKPEDGGQPGPGQPLKRLRSKCAPEGFTTPDRRTRSVRSPTPNKDDKQSGNAPSLQSPKPGGTPRAGKTARKQKLLQARASFNLHACILVSHGS